MTISIDAEKTFDKVQYLFMKVLKKLLEYKEHTST